LRIICLINDAGRLLPASVLPGNVMDLLKIHDEYYERVRRFILSVVKDTWGADDLTQETFIRISKHINALHDPSRLSPWIFRIAWNLCMDYHKNKRSPEMNNQESLLEITGGIRILDSLEQHEMGACVQEKIRALPENLRVSLILFDVEGLSHSEIAEILDISIENSKVRLHRARTELKVILENECRFERNKRDVFVCLPVEDPL